MTINQINSISSDRYGCGIIGLDSTAALWLAEFIFKTHGVNVYRKISQLRNKYGRCTAYPEYGTELFKGA